MMSGWGMARRFDPEDPELMDRPQPVSAALEKDLENLRGLNRWFGAWRIIRHWLGPRLTRGRALRIVDLCTGSGDLPILMVEMARAAGCPVVDQSWGLGWGLARMAVPSGNFRPWHGT